MILHEDKEIFKQAIRATADRLNFPAIYVEKDYWVTYILHLIFKDERVRNEAVFKGGTALSKCFSLIDRFSEDIDLVVIRRENEADNQMAKKIKTITTIVNDKLPEIFLEEVTNKYGKIRKTAHPYSKEFEGDFGQVRNVIIVEATWLGRYEPYHKASVSSYIYDMMKSNNQLAMAEKNGLMPFEVQVLDVRRTICEKIMSLVRFSQTENYIIDLKNKIRHTYDINQLLKEKEIEEYFESDEFIEMLLNVAEDDISSFKNNNDWLKKHPSSTRIFSDTEKVWNEIKDAYSNNFRGLVHGEFPEQNEILQTLIRVRDRIKDMPVLKWMEL
jgi:predicted nucleotidyltransferase component of viral defense system